MSDSIRELIIKNLATALSGITAANGFDNSVLSVQRHFEQGNTFSSVPCLIVTEDDEERVQETTEPFIYKRLSVVVSIITRIDDATDTRSADEAINSLRADVERAVQADHTRGGYAMDTRFEGSGPLDVLDGQPESGAFMVFSILYRHRRKDPKTL